MLKVMDYLVKEKISSEVLEEVQRAKQVDSQIRFKRSDDNPELPENFKVGQAIGGGDCFFDSIAKGLKQLKPDMEFTVKSLRKVCKDLAVGNQQLKSKVVKDARNSHDPTTIVPDDNVSDDELWNAYLATIEYTNDDINKMRYDNQGLYRSLTGLKYGSTLQAPIWGRPDIEGQMICRKYNIKLHLVEWSTVAAIWLHQVVDGTGSKSVENADYNDVSTVHIINKGNAHFEPVLSIQGVQHHTKAQVVQTEFQDRVIDKSRRGLTAKADKFINWVENEIDYRNSIKQEIDLDLRNSIISYSKALVEAASSFNKEEKELLISDLKFWRDKITFPLQQEYSLLRGLFGDVDVYSIVSVRAKEGLNYSLQPKEENFKNIYSVLLKIIYDGLYRIRRINNIRNLREMSLPEEIDIFDKTRVGVDNLLDSYNIEINFRFEEFSFLDMAVIEGRDDIVDFLISYYDRHGFKYNDHGFNIDLIKDEMLDSRTIHLIEDGMLGWRTLYYACLGQRSSITAGYFKMIFDGIVALINQRKASSEYEKGIMTKFIASMDDVVEEINVLMNSIVKRLAEKVDLNQLEAHNVYDAKNHFGISFLNLVLQNRKIPLISRLSEVIKLEEPMDELQKNTPLHLVSEPRSIDEQQEEQEELMEEYKMAEAIISHIDEINLKNYLGNTALHNAVIHGNKYLVDLLLRNSYLSSRGRILIVKNNNGMTAIHLAALSENLEILKILLRVAAKADLNIKNANGETVIEMIEKATPVRQNVLEILKQQDYEDWKGSLLRSELKKNFPVVDSRDKYATTRLASDLSVLVEKGYQFLLEERYYDATTCLQHAVNMCSGAEEFSYMEKRILAKAHWLLSIANWSSGESKSSFLNIKTSIVLFKDLKDYFTLELVYRDLAKIYFFNYNYEVMVNYYRLHQYGIRNSNSDVGEKICSHLALAGLISVVQSYSLELNSPINDYDLIDCEYSKASLYSTAYRLSEGGLVDNSAHIVLQREMGIAYSENIGTYNVQECVAIVAYVERKVVLCHFDVGTDPLRFIDQIIEQFPDDCKINIRIIGGKNINTLFRDGKHRIAYENVDQVLKQLYHFQERFNIQSIDVNHPSLPSAVVFDVKNKRLVHSIPNRPDESLDSRLTRLNVLVNIEPNEYLSKTVIVDFSKSEQDRKQFFDDSAIKVISDVYRSYSRKLIKGRLTEFAWSYDQIFYPLIAVQRNDLRKRSYILQVVRKNMEIASLFEPFHLSVVDMDNRFYQGSWSSSFPVSLTFPSVESSSLSSRDGRQPLDTIDFVFTTLQGSEYRPPQECSQLNKREAGRRMLCVDSRDEEEITEEEKEQRIKELFGIEAYDAEIITIDSSQVSIDSDRVNIKFKDNNGNDRQLIIDNSSNIKSIENYILSKENLEMKLKVSSDKEYAIMEEIKELDIKYYLSIDGYKVKLDSIIKDFTTDTEKKAIHDKLHQLSNEIELFENKKYIEDIGGAKDIEIINQGYDYIINEIKQSLLEKGIREDTFDRVKSYFDGLNEKVFAEYIDNVEENLKKQGIKFDRDKFNSAKVKGAKSGKFFSLMAICDLFDSIGDTATLGRYDNDALKQVFGINGVLDAMDDVRTSVNISPNSKVGKLIDKIPGPVRQAFVKVISNPVVQSITFATITYQFGYSVNEIAQGNHHPLNYYWAASGGVKLASMSIRPISIGVSFTIKSVSATAKILRGLSAAGKVLGKMSVFTMVPDIVFSLHQSLYSKTMESQAIAAQIPISNVDRAKIFFSNSEREIYENYIKVKSYLDTVKSNVISYLNSDPNIAAVVQYVTSIEEKYSEIIKTVEKKSSCAGAGLGCNDQWICGLEKKYESISFGKVDMASNIRGNLSSLNISRPLDLEFYQLNNIGATRFKSKEYEEFLAKQEKAKVYLISKDAKYLPNITQDEYNNGLRVVMAPSGHLIPQHQCSDAINKERIFRPYTLSEVYKPCNAGKIYKNCQETFTLSGEPFIFTNSTRKDPGNTKKQTFPKESILYISGPKTLTAAANYPAVMYIPKGGNIRYIGSKNNETIFVINDHTSGTLEGGAGKENTVVMSVKTNNIVANLHGGTIRYGSRDNIRLVNTYNYVSNTDSKQNITTHCRTRLINAKNAKVQQTSFNCTDKDYEVRVVNKDNVHHRGLKQTIFIVNKDSGNARIVSDFNYTEKVKKNTDVLDAQVVDIRYLRVGKSREGGGYSLDLLSNGTQSIIPSIKIDNLENLVIQTKRLGIIESIIIQDKSLSDIIADMRYQKLNDLGKNIDREVIQNSEKKLKAVIQASILDLERPNAYQAAKNIADNNNLGIPISEVEVIKNYVGVPTEKVIISGTYSNRIIVDFSYGDSNSTHSYLRYRASGGVYDYYQYMIVCNYCRDVMVEGRGEQDQYVIKLPEYGQILQQKTLRSPVKLDLNLKIKNRAKLYQSIPDDIIGLTALNVVDVDSISIKKGKRTYFNKCNSREVSGLTKNSLEIRNVTVLGSEGIKWSLSIGLVNYFRGQEYQNIVLQMNNKFYKINSANLELEHVEVNAKPFRYYQPDEQGLQIYHNQPINANDIGLVDLKEKSIFDFDMKIVGDGLLLLHKNNTIARVENCNTYQPARKMIFAFNDTIVSNSNCIAFTCNSEDIIAAFNKAKEILLKEQLFNAIRQNNTNEVKNLISKIADNVDTKDKHELISLHIAIQEGRLDVVKLLFNRRSFNVGYKDIRDYSPLHWAAQEGKLGIAEFFVDRGANTEDRNEDGETPEDLANQKGYTYIVKFLKQIRLDRELLTAAGSGDLNKVKDLINQGASLEAKNNNDGATPLNYASQNGHFNTVKCLIRGRANLETQDSNGSTPLHYASLNSHFNIVKYLIEEGANLETQDSNGSTPLHYASLSGRLNIVKYLIEEGANLETQDSNGSTPLHYASLSGHLNIVKYLIEEGANLETQDSNGSTPLHYASLSGRLNIVEYLVGKGAILEVKDKYGKIPLDLADQKGHVNIVKFLRQAQLNRELLIAAQSGSLDEIRSLVGQGASLNAKKYSNGWTLMHCAAYGGNLDVIKYFVEDTKSSLEIKDNSDRVPLHYAAYNGKLDVIKYFVDEKKVDVNIKDSDGWTALHLASWNDHLNLIEYCVGKGANINAKNKDDKTPLNIAIDRKYDDVVEYLQQAQLDLNKRLLNAVQGGDFKKVEDLVSQGANIEAKDIYGWTPLHFAASCGKLDIVEFLFDKNASTKAKDMYGSTPLHVAVQYNSKLETVEFLLNKDASGINDIANNGLTPLHLAVQGNKLSTVRLLLDRGANIKVKDVHGQTPLGLAIREGYTDIIRTLEREQLGKELFTAVREYDFSRVKNLISRGANVDVKNGNGKTPLDITINTKKALEENQGSPNELLTQQDRIAGVLRKQKELNRELFTAVREENLPKVRDLIRQGANVDTREDGKTPLDIAKEKLREYSENEECSDVVRCLEKLNQGRGGTVRRKRRHHHGDYSRRKPLAIDQLEIAASDGTKPSSWINDLFGWVKSSIDELLSSNTTSSISQVDGRIDVDGVIMLLDLLVRKVTGQKYISTVDQPISSLEAQEYALNIIEKFEKVLNETATKSGISVTNLNFDPVAVQSAIVGQIISEKFSKISKTLYSFAKEACPEFKQTGKFLAHLRSSLEGEKEAVLLQQKVEKPSKILDQQVSRKVELSKKPDTFLNGTSVVKGISNVLER